MRTTLHLLGCLALAACNADDTAVVEISTGDSSTLDTAPPTSSVSDSTTQSPESDSGVDSTYTSTSSDTGEDPSTGVTPTTTLSCTWDLARPLYDDYGGTVTARSADDVWSCSTDCIHWDGDTWTTVSLDDEDDYTRRAWADADDAVWTVRTEPQDHSVHWAGGDWMFHDFASSLYVSNVHGSASDDVWAFGTNLATGGIVQRWQGVAWADVSPDTGGAASGIAGGWVRGPNDVVAIGRSPTDEGLILEWDGVLWNSTTLDEDLRDIWSDGESTFLLAFPDLVLRNDAGGWIDAAPPIGDTSYELTAVSASELYALHGAANETMVSRLDGDAWSPVTNEFTSIWAMDGHSEGLAFAGSREDECGITTVVRGTLDDDVDEFAWQFIGASPPWIDNDATIYFGRKTIIGEVACDDADLPWYVVTGDWTGNLYGLSSASLWIGEGAELVEYPFPAGFNPSIVAADGAQDVWLAEAVCTNPCVGGIRRWDGETWYAAPDIDQVSAIGVAAQTLWAVTAQSYSPDGPLARLDGETWAAIDVPIGRIVDLAPVDATTAYLVLDTGTFGRIDDTEWTPLGDAEGMPASPWAGLSATGPNDVLVFGGNGADKHLWHFDGHSWAGVEVDLPGDATPLISKAPGGATILMSSSELRRGQCTRE